jgi:hypothetical protein
MQLGKCTLLCLHNISNSEHLQCPLHSVHRLQLAQQRLLLPKHKRLLIHPIFVPVNKLKIEFVENFRANETHLVVGQAVHISTVSRDHLDFNLLLPQTIPRAHRERLYRMSRITLELLVAQPPLRNIFERTREVLSQSVSR